MEGVTMRSISRNVGVGLIGLLIALLGTSNAATAGSCGDANRTGTVTVTDGVLILRAAAQLPGTICPRERCDMNLDNALTVTDGVLALRVAAGIQTSTSCSSAQADALFGRITKTIPVGGSQSSAAARARAANTTTPCSFGGSQSDDGTTLTFDQCAED